MIIPDNKSPSVKRETSFREGLSHFTNSVSRTLGYNKVNNGTAHRPPLNKPFNNEPKKTVSHSLLKYVNQMYPKL